VTPSSKPLLIYDGRCGFCKIWIDYWKLLTADGVDYAPSQEVGAQYPDIPREDFSEAVQLVRPDGSVSSGARAVFETLNLGHVYESSRPFSAAAEWAYRFIARHRDLFYQLTRFTFGTRLEPTGFQYVQWLFLRALAIVYMIAFGSLAVQVSGLIGERGITPAQSYFEAVARQFGPMRFAALPSVFWANSSDGALTAAAWCGVGLAILLLAGYVERLMLILLYLLYLSFSSAGQEFLSFQWDSLLLEAGFLAIFFARSRMGLRTIGWLFRWLVFRLYFLSGLVKLASHDPTWRNLTALEFHFETQPLPNRVSWYVDKLPPGFQHFSTFMVLAIELALPFLIFAPRRWRMFGASCLIGLQLLIMLTGNYTFFNWLTIALTLFLFDDQAIRGVASRFIAKRIRNELDERPAETRRTNRLALALLSLLVLGLGIAHIFEYITGLPDPIPAVVNSVSPYQIVNSYGLFAVMTTNRPEIIVEGSSDGETWLPYEFRYKPGDLYQPPRWVAPHQPRLDWQMWFAALGNYQSNLWFIGFAERLLEGSPEVLALLEKNPFPEHPPRLIRAQLYDYAFTEFSERRATGAWWKRQQMGEYLPPMGLRSTASSIPVHSRCSENTLQALDSVWGSHSWLQPPFRRLSGVRFDLSGWPARRP
jgi:hypothetical protein